MRTLSQAQKYAVEILRKLLCARHEQLHWLISRKFQDVDPEKIMRQLNCLSMAINDGKHYLWPGCELNPDRVVATEIMLEMANICLPLFETAHYPCALIFFLMTETKVQAFRIYIVKEGEELECAAVAENQQHPLNHAVVFYIQSRSQMALINVSHPHVFAVCNNAGKITFIEASS